MVQKWLSTAYLCSLLLCFFSGLLNTRSSTRALQIILLLLGLTVLTELVGIYLYKVPKLDNMPVYNVSSLLQYALLVVFYRAASPVLRRSRVASWLIADGALFWLADLVLWQPINRPNTYFLAYNGLCAVVLSSFLIVEYLGQDSRSSNQVAEFRISLLFSFFWSATFFVWGLMDVVYQSNLRLLNMLLDILWLVGSLTYLGIGLVFLFFYRAQPKR